MRIEILHERDPDSGCAITVWVNGVEVTADVVDIDPGRGYERSEWDDDAASESAAETGRSEAFRRAVATAFDAASESKYID